MLATALDSGRLVPVETGPWKLLFKRSFDVEQAKRQQPAIEAVLATAMGRAISLLIETGEVSAPAAPVVDRGSDAPPSLDDAPASEAPEPAKPAPVAGGLKRAANILGGTAKFIKKKE